MTTTQSDTKGRSIDDVPRTLKVVQIGSQSGTAPQAPRFVVQPIVPKGVVTLLGAHGGAGKTILALALAAHVAAGRAWAGCKVEQGRALFVSLEDPAPLILYRLNRVIEAHDLSWSAVTDNLAIVDGSEGDAALVGEQNEYGVRRLMPTATMQELRELASGFDLIVIDNASDAFDADENNRRQVRGFIRYLTEIARDNACGLLLLAHIDKTAARYGTNGNSYSGSTAWHNSARSRLALVEADGGVDLRQEKLNLGKAIDRIALQWSQHGILMPQEPRLDSSGSDSDAVLSAIRAAAAAGIDVGAARSGPATAQMVLGTFLELPAHLRGPRGRDAFWLALSRLLGSGAVVVRESRGANRHPRRCLVESRAPNAATETARANPPHPLRNGARAPECGAMAAPVCVNPEPARTSAEMRDSQDYRTASRGE